MHGGKVGKLNENVRGGSRGWPNKFDPFQFPIVMGAVVAQPLRLLLRHPITRGAAFILVSFRMNYSHWASDFVAIIFLQDRRPLVAHNSPNLCALPRPRLFSRQGVVNWTKSLLIRGRPFYLVSATSSQGEGSIAFKKKKACHVSSSMKGPSIAVNKKRNPWSGL